MSAPADGDFSVLPVPGRAGVYREAKTGRLIRPCNFRDRLIRIWSDDAPVCLPDRTRWNVHAIFPVQSMDGVAGEAVLYSGSTPVYKASVAALQDLSTRLAGLAGVVVRFHPAKDIPPLLDVLGVVRLVKPFSVAAGKVLFLRREGGDGRVGLDLYALEMETPPPPPV